MGRVPIWLSGISSALQAPFTLNHDSMVGTQPNFINFGTLRLGHHGTTILVDR